MYVKAYFITKLYGFIPNSVYFVFSRFYAVMSGWVKTTFPFTKSNSICMGY